MTSQERLALGVMALLLAAGAGARALRTPDPATLEGAAAVEMPLATLTAQVRDSVAAAERRRTPLATGERIDPNVATADELDRLPRVGPAVAARIVAWRQARGAFRTLADLDSVPGVGPALLEQVAPHLTLAAAPVLAERPPAGAPALAGGATAGAIDLNTASAAQLATLPGIGPALAARIVAWRDSHGRFRSVDALADVPGIGPATVERVRPLARVTP